MDFDLLEEKFGQHGDPNKLNHHLPVDLIWLFSVSRMKKKITLETNKIECGMLFTTNDTNGTRRRKEPFDGRIKTIINVRNSQTEGYG